MNKQKEIKFRFKIPFRTIANFQGEGMYEETLEDHFRYSICEPIRQKNIEYEFDFHAFDVPEGFGMELKTQSDDFDMDSIIKKLVEMRFRLGLNVTKYSNGQWIDLYNDSRRTLYNF